jgi:hypothetical protein
MASTARAVTQSPPTPSLLKGHFCFTRARVPETANREAPKPAPGESLGTSSAQRGASRRRLSTQPAPAPASGAATSTCTTSTSPTEARPRRGRDRAAGRDLRSPTHLRHLRAPCRHLHVRPLPLHGRQPDDDRPALRPPRARRTRARDPPALRTERGQRPRWTLVDAAWTSQPTAASDGLEPSTPSLPGRNPRQRFRLDLAIIGRERFCDRLRPVATTGLHNGSIRGCHLWQHTTAHRQPSGALCLGR